MKTGTKLVHYKGGRYTIIGKATHSETLEDMFIYQNDKDGKVWVRPEKMFYEEVEHKGKWVPRFGVVVGAVSDELAELVKQSPLYRGIEDLIGKLEQEKEPVCKGCHNKVGRLIEHPSGYCYTCYRKIKDAGGNPD